MGKGRTNKDLKAKGSRRGEKNGAIVKLEHLKTFAIINLWNEYCNG